MKFPIIVGTVFFLGTKPVVYVGGGQIEFEGVETTDQLAETLSAAGQKVFGQYVSHLAHEETVTKRDGITGEEYRVRVRVTYVAGGARHEEEISAREPVVAQPLPPPPAAPVPPQPEAPAPVAASGGEISSDAPVAEPGGVIDNEAAPVGTVVPPSKPETAPAATTETAAVANFGPGGIERREQTRRLVAVGPPPEGERRQQPSRRAEDRAATPPQS